MKFLIIPVVLLVAACQTSPSTMAQSDRLKWRTIDSLQLQVTLPVHIGYSRAFIQDGRSLRESLVDKRRPWCQFRQYEPPEALQQERTIEPGQFDVTRTYHSNTAAIDQPVMVASSVVIAFDYDRGPSSRILSNILELSSAQQPQVVEFMCGIFTEPAPERYVTFSEMRAVVGDLVTFNLSEY